MCKQAMQIVAASRAVRYHRRSVHGATTESEQPKAKSVSPAGASEVELVDGPGHCFTENKPCVCC